MRDWKPARLPRGLCLCLRPGGAGAKSADARHMKKAARGGLIRHVPGALPGRAIEKNQPARC